MHWEGLAHAQAGVVARRQLRELGMGSDRIRNQVSAGRWARRTPTVLTCFTGPLTREQHRWVGVLHPSGDGVVAGVDGLAMAGLRSWEREEIDVLVARGVHVPGVVAGVRFVRTRRDLTRWVRARSAAPHLAVEAAGLLHASSCPSEREAQGLLAATVQQRLTTPQRLRETLGDLPRLPRGPLIRRLLTELEGGAQSLAEVDVNSMCDAFGLMRPARQVARTDSAGRRRYTDCEWQLADGRTLVLEVDGAHHMAVGQWEDDLRRRRRLSQRILVIVDCTSREVRDEPDVLARDLIALGVPLRERSA